MKPPDSAKVTETQNSKYWFDDGILYAVSKKAPELSMEEQKKLTREFMKKLNGKKICAIMDVTDATPSSREVREYNTKILPEIFKAIAFVSKNPLGRMLATLYLGFKPIPFPVKIFSGETEAKEWLKKYI